MDESKRKHDGVDSDEERSFAETLIDEQAPDTAPPASKKPAKATSKQPPWAGKVMGHFKLLRLIGEGTVGMVIQAEDTGLRRLVALKVLRKQFSTGEKGKTAIEQFLREARAAAALEHPNIVRVYEINQHAGWWYIAMEMVEGNSLQDIIKATGSLPEGRACPIIADVALGLQAAHEIGMIHRDVKPGNILVTRNGRGKLTDFGLVRVDDPNDPDDTYEHRSVGTPLYMAPEMIRRQRFGPAADIYSLGATLYHALTGHPPYRSEKVKEVLDQHLHKDPPDIRSSLELCSPTLATLIQRMMSKDPDARPNAADVAAALHAEAISSYSDASGTGSSGVGSTWHGQQPATRLGGTDTGSGSGEVAGSGIRRLTRAILKPWHRAFAAALILLFIVGSLIYWAGGGRMATGVEVASLFPDAPDSYGTRQAGSVLVSPAQAGPVGAFSWKNSVELPECRFVASRTGRYYYPVDDERANLIRAELVIGYEIEQQARTDGKLAAPDM